jgi:threonine aldolase
MCNQVAFSVHCRAGDEIILHETAHPLLYEAGGAAALVGAVFRPLQGARGRFSAAQVREALRPPVHYMPRSRVVSIEQTANIVGGACWPLAEVESVAAAAREAGLAVHMDGARLMNAVVATGTPARSLAAPVDSVWLDLTKGLGAPLGAVLAGSRAFLQEAWIHKQRLGGALRQAGIVAAAGLHALEHHVERLAEDHARASELASGLAELPGIAVDPAAVETNIVIFDVRGTGMSGEEFGARTLASHGVRFSVLGPAAVRAVTHLDVPPDGIERALAAARAAVAEGTRR